ncbi:hypothetical protein CEXT_184011 [Caerostris extrusa]|uniref:Uncharacterized protein n=1 Tax=Caerostris extrusa TaxID=172846 RepID=A0AAV4TKX8_CAEEX|nr:hypothetical protein CEXT_184011 [Caerostris extrusa]
MTRGIPSVKEQNHQQTQNVGSYFGRQVGKCKSTQSLSVLYASQFRQETTLPVTFAFKVAGRFERVHPYNKQTQSSTQSKLLFLSDSNRTVYPRLGSDGSDRRQ